MMNSAKVRLVKSSTLPVSIPSRSLILRFSVWFRVDNQIPTLSNSSSEASSPRRLRQTRLPTRLARGIRPPLHPPRREGAFRPVSPLPGTFRLVRGATPYGFLLGRG